MEASPPPGAPGINKAVTLSRRGAEAQRRFFDRIYRIFWISDSFASVRRILDSEF